MIKQHKKQTGIRNLIYANLGLICLVSCSTAFQPRSKADSLKNAAIVPVAPAWLEKIKKNVDNFHSADLFPKESLNYVPPKIIKSKYDKILKGGLAGHGADFEEAAKKNGIPVDLLIAICAWETGNGTSKILRDCRNPGGNLKYNKATKKWIPYSFKTVKLGIEFTASNLSRNYWKKGLRSVSKIGSKYAPSKTDKGMKHSDPSGINNNWVGGVRKMQQMVNKV